MPMYNLLEYSDSNSIHQKVGRITIETKLMRLMLTLLRMGFLGLVTDGGGVKRPSPDPKMCHTSCIDETWHRYTLPKENSKNI